MFARASAIPRCVESAREREERYIHSVKRDGKVEDYRRVCDAYVCVQVLKSRATIVTIRGYYCDCETFRKRGKKRAESGATRSQVSRRHISRVTDYHVFLKEHTEKVCINVAILFSFTCSRYRAEK